jgi:hypothetical protein
MNVIIKIIVERRRKMSCETCVSCQDCDGCNTCNDSCNNCDNGNCTTCDDAQTYCKVQEVYSIDCSNKFAWNGKVTAGSELIKLTDWNRLPAYVKALRSKGIGGKSTSGITTQTDKEVKASWFNNYAALVGSSKRATAGKTYIYGSYFEDLANKANDLTYEKNQCTVCNTGCNTCDSCKGCNLCKSGNTTSSKCKSGNTCTTDCSQTSSSS